MFSFTNLFYGLPQISERELREAVLACFCDPPGQQAYTLLPLSESQWRSLLPWLDTSGLALYLYDRLDQLALLKWLPQAIDERLRQNIADNRLRTHSMLAEAVDLHYSFRKEGIEHLLIKGVSLVPASVPRPELRSQLDLDFLVTAKGIHAAHRLLERRGYILQAVSGRSWEFKTAAEPARSLRDLYKDHPSRCIELHIEADAGSAGPRIEDAEWRSVCGFDMPVLRPESLFVGQAAHLYKHLSTGFFRCSHVLELYRHIITRGEDAEFWEKVQEEVARNEGMRLPLGVTTLLLTRVMGEFAPPLLLEFAEELSAPIRLWTEAIGPRCVYTTWPGGKLHLLLQRELDAGSITKRKSLRKALLPTRLPTPIAQAPAQESLPERARRIWRELSYLCFRLRYHLVSGAQYAWELRRWKRLSARSSDQRNVSIDLQRRSARSLTFPRQTKE